MTLATLEETHAKWRLMGLHRDWNIFRTMQESLWRRPKALAVFHSPAGLQSITLAELHDRAARLAAGLKDGLGLRAGDCLAVQLPNCLDNAVVSVACARLGVILLPIIHIFGPAEINYILRDSGARFLIMPDSWRNTDFLERMSQVESPSLENILVLGDTAPEGRLRFSDYANAEGAVPDPAPVPATDVAIMLYTSGTTSAPKGVRHSHQSFVAEFLAHILDQRDMDSPWLSPWPSGHIAGALGLMGHAIVGRDAVVMEQWDPSAAAMLIERYKVVQTSGTPLHLLGILEAAERDNRSLKSLRLFMTGATTVPETVVARAEALEVHACRCYGSTELPTSTQCQPHDPLHKRLTTDGRPLPGAEIRIVDDDLNDVPVGVDGEILVRAAECALGYTDPDRTAEAFLPGGWFRTGDIGKLDDEGYMTVTDRKKDIIIRGGENISSLEVEDLLLQMDGVRDVAAVAAPHERLGEIVCVFIVPAEDAEITIATIDAHFRTKGVARQKTPERLELVPALPRTPAGKVLKTELRDIARGKA